MTLAGVKTGCQRPELGLTRTAQRGPDSMHLSVTPEPNHRHEPIHRLAAVHQLSDSSHLRFLSGYRRHRLRPRGSRTASCDRWNPGRSSSGGQHIRSTRPNCPVRAGRPIDPACPAGLRCEPAPNRAVAPRQLDRETAESLRQMPTPAAAPRPARPSRPASVCRDRW
jgi:hypothetical protein